MKKIIIVELNGGKKQVEQTIEMILRTIIVHIVAEGQLAPHPTHRETTKPDGQWQKFASGYCQPGGCLCQGFCRSIEDESPISYIFSGLKWVEVLKMFLSFMMSLVMSIAMSPKVIARYEHGIRLCLSSSEAVANMIYEGPRKNPCVWPLTTLYMSAESARNGRAWTTHQFVASGGQGRKGTSVNEAIDEWVL